MKRIESEFLTRINGHIGIIAKIIEVCGIITIIIGKVKATIKYLQDHRGKISDSYERYRGCRTVF